jgi:TfoX/Sxy family transcriptional regulator of competence genes
MAFDEALLQRVRVELRGVEGVTEKRMMGGMCLLVNGNMLGGVDKTKSGEDRLMFRIGKDQEAAALSRPGASIVDMGGRRMGGFVFVDARGVHNDALGEWLGMALRFVKTLPAK